MATLTGGRGWASDACAASVHRMDSAFGRILPITSAGRSYQEQADAYYRYRYRGGPLALPPGTSIHESGNAIDWGSSVWELLGLTWGLGWRGAPINKHGHRRTVSTETWHAEYDPSKDNYIGQGAGSGGGSVGRPSILAVQQWLNANRGAGLTEDGIDGPATQAAVRAYQTALGVKADGVWGPGTEAAHVAAQGGVYAQYGGQSWIRAIQNKLNRLGYGTLLEDGIDGPATRAAVKAFQSANGLGADGVAGPITNNKMDELLSAAPVGGNQSGRSTYDIQKFLLSKGFDLGQWGADGDYGPSTTTAVVAYQKSVGLTPDGVWGPLTDAKAFTALPVEPPTTQYPTTGRNATTRPTAKIQKLVGLPAGEQDGEYGPLTSQAVAKWQSQNGLDADGIWGPASDLKGFPGVPLPDAPTEPGADPLYGKKLPVYPGAAWADVSPNKSVREGTVQLFIIHHRADTGNADSARKRFMAANDRNVSPNWNINQNGTVDEIVPPDNYRAWTTGQIDHFAVTVETGNTSGEPTWGISPESKEAIANVVAWAANRYKFPIQAGATKLEGGKAVVVQPGVLGHGSVAGQSTACPGPAMDVPWLIARAKQIFQEKYVEVPPVVVPPVVTPPTSTMATVPVEFLEQLRANQLSDAEEIAKYLD